MNWKELLNSDNIKFLIVLLIVSMMGIKTYQTAQIYNKKYTYKGTIKKMYTTESEYKGTVDVNRYMNVDFDNEGEDEILVTKETFDKFHTGQRIAFTFEKGRIHPPQEDGIPVIVQMLFMLASVISVLMGIVFSFYMVCYLIPYILFNPGKFFKTTKKKKIKNYSDTDRYSDDDDDPY